jgi:hypothetical protein
VARPALGRELPLEAVALAPAAMFGELLGPALVVAALLILVAGGSFRLERGQQPVEQHADGREHRQLAEILPGALRTRTAVLGCSVGIIRPLASRRRSPVILGIVDWLARG